MAEKSRRGFAAMDREKQRQIASKGGKAAHAKGSAHEFTPDQAREAGRKGGRAAHARGTAHKFTSKEAQEAGRKGGLNSHRAAAARRASGDAGNADEPNRTEGMGASNGLQGQGVGNNPANPGGEMMPERHGDAHSHRGEQPQQEPEDANFDNANPQTEVSHAP